MEKRTDTNVGESPAQEAGDGIEDSEMMMAEEDNQVEGEESEPEMIVVGDDAGDEGDGDDVDMDTGEDKEGTEVRTYLPGDQMEDGETLTADLSAYHMLHTVNVDWPCLSFDVLPDALGEGRDSYPMAMYVVAGTQAEKANQNRLEIMKFSELRGTGQDDDSDSDTDTDTEKDAAPNEQPVLAHKAIRHFGAINRLRLCRQRPELVAAWSEKGQVNIYDINKAVVALDDASAAYSETQQPMFVFSGHSTEGFSVDWSPVTTGRLATGDCAKHIYVWEMTETGWDVNKAPYNGHQASVEDIQWSPSEANVMASCSVDQSLCIWDTRKRQAPALRIQAHESDVNVLHWNRLVSYLMVTGGDDGIIKVWDLRTFKSGQPDPVAKFKWHTGPITSVEWHPSEESVLAASGADDQTTLWDLSVEADPEQSRHESLANVPPQLLFIHQGQKEIKEHHWHPQCPGVLLTTASTGFNVFKTISV